MNFSYKYKLSPTRKQEFLLEEILYTCRMLYNSEESSRVAAERAQLAMETDSSQWEFVD